MSTKGAGPCMKRKSRIERLVADLASDDGTVRKRAREALVELGREATGRLTALLADERIRLRWEAARALVDIADPAAAPSLIAALEDAEFEIRWLAAEALVALGRAGLIPLLWRLARPPHTPELRDGAHHVLSELKGRVVGVPVGRVLEALSGPAWAEATSLAATGALLQGVKGEAQGAP